MNLSTVIVAVLVAALFIAIVAGEIQKKKQGKGSCSCGCSGCAMEGRCHK